MRLAGATALVTGGAGFIGSHLVDHLIDRDVARVIVVDTLWLGRESNLAGARARRPDLELLKVDAADSAMMQSIVDRARVDVVFNLATKPLGYSFTDPRGAYMTSVEIAASLAELLRAGAFGRLVHYSTSEIYGDAQTVPMSEDHPTRPTTPYAAGKLAADLLLQSWVGLFSIPVLTIRPFNNYGPRQNDRDYGAVIPVTMRRIAAGLPPILEGTGEQTRDFTFVRDTVRLTADLCERDEAWGQTLNVAGGVEVQIGHIIGAICRAMGYGGGVLHHPPRPGDHRRHLASTERARRLVPFGELTSIDAGIAETVAWYRTQERHQGGRA
jgi:UDP-glucose 4-epimerase